MKKVLLFVVGMILFSKNTQAQWTEVGGLDALAANGPIKTMCADKAGNIYAAGGFRNDSGYFYVAKWDGNSWSELGGVNGIKANDIINAICSDKQGNIYAGGQFMNGPLGDSFVEKWNGSNWSVLGDISGSWNYVNALCSDPFDNIYAVGDLYQGMSGPFIARWNGNNWNRIIIEPHPVVQYQIYSTCSDQTGNIYLAGWKVNNVNYVGVNYGGNISQFGSTLSNLPYNSKVLSICSGINGNIYAGGSFTNGNYSNLGHYYIAYGNGSIWAEVGGKDALAANAPILCVFKTTTSKLLAAGDFTNASGSNYVAMYNGVGWSELGGYNSLAANGTIRTICEDTAGNIYVAGDFTNANGNQYVAVISKALGINETQYYSISLSPNPTTGIITIKGITQPSVAVYNLMGQKVVASQGSNEVSLVQLPAGMYLVQVFSKDGVLVKSEKVIRE